MGVRKRNILSNLSELSRRAGKIHAMLAIDPPDKSRAVETAVRFFFAVAVRRSELLLHGFDNLESKFGRRGSGISIRKRRGSRCCGRFRGRKEDEGKRIFSVVRSR